MKLDLGKSLGFSLRNHLEYRQELSLEERR